jgi:hypothetical protein
VKGWAVAHGETQERIWDVACTGREILDASCGGAVGDTVDVATPPGPTRSLSPSAARSGLDPDFEPSLKAFHFARVIEIATPRWTAYDAAKFNVDQHDHAVMVHRTATAPVLFAMRQLAEMR